MAMTWRIKLTSQGGNPRCGSRNSNPSSSSSRSRSFEEACNEDALRLPAPEVVRMGVVTRAKLGILAFKDFQGKRSGPFGRPG